jgi:uncharacterized protein YhbP (UPF0306 family)
MFGAGRGYVREPLESYVQVGKVIQVATLDEQGDPYVNNLWFASSLNPDRLYFISRPTRVHCENIRNRGRVAGGVLAIELHGLGQAVRGVTFTGHAVELATSGIDVQIQVYVDRWPEAAKAIDPVGMARRDAPPPMRSMWIAGSSTTENFRADPRQPVVRSDYEGSARQSSQRSLPSKPQRR